MNDSTYKNLLLTDFPIKTDIAATKDTIEIIKDAEAAFNWMLRHAFANGQRPAEVKLFLVDRRGEQRYLLMRSVAAVEGDTETIKEFYATQKPQKESDQD